MSLKVKHPKKEDNAVYQFQKRYPTALGRKRALNKMSDSQIDKLIEDTGTAQGRIALKAYKKGRGK